MASAGKSCSSSGKSNDDSFSEVTETIQNRRGFIANQPGFDPGFLFHLLKGQSIESIVVSTYFQLLNQRRRPEGCESLKALPVVLFDETLAQTHRTFLYSLGDDIDILTGTALIPVILSARNHFTLVVFDNDACAITLWDPTNLRLSELLEACKTYVLENKPDGGDRYTTNRKQGIPRQCNQRDCGVFVMAYADRLMKGDTDMDFDVNDIKTMRLSFTLDLLHSNLDETA